MEIRHHGKKKHGKTGSSIKGENDFIDSNILIHSADEKYKHLRDLFKRPDAMISVISRLEVLGYHRITAQQIVYFETIFTVTNVIDITSLLIDQAIYYRRKKSMSVADSIIAATAKLFYCDLYTNNDADFKNIKDFKIVNTF